MSELFKRYLTNSMVRPFLTFFVTVLYNVVMVWLVFSNRISPETYVNSIGPMNAMIIGFWFAERAVSKGSKP